MYAQGLTRLSPPVRRLSSRIYRPRALHSTSKRWQGDARNVRPSNSATSALSAEAVDALWQTARKKLAEVPKVPSPSSIAGALLLIPVAGGAWFVTVYALRQRLCEHRLQQVDGVGISHPSGGRRKRQTRHNGGNGRDANETAPLRPGSTADARALREILSTPAKGVTVLCLDPPASYTGEAFLSSALSGRAATVHIRAGEGDGALVACLARGLGIPFVIAKLQISWMLSGLGLAGREGSGVPATGSNAQEMKDLAAVLETATAALEEIRGQAVDPRNHLPPVIVLDGILGHVREGEDIPAPVEAVLRWCWTITGGRRLAHVVLTAPQSMAVDGSLVRVREFLNDGRLSPSMVHVVGLNAPDGGVTEKRFRACLSSCTTARNRYGPRDSTDQEGEVTGEGENERAVKLAMELIEGEDFGVAEEANEVLRRIRASSSFSLGKKTALSVSYSVGRALGGIAFEAWRRVSAAVTETNSHAIPYALLDDPPLALGWESNAMRSVSKTVEGERNAKPVPSTRRASVGIPPSNSGDFHLRGLHGRAAMDSRRGFVVDDYSPLEMSDFASLQDSAPDGEVETDYSGALLSPESEDDSNVSVGGAYAPASPLDELLGLMGALADGSSLTVTDAVARLGGDGQRLARLLDLGVLRLRPRTAFSMSSLAPEDSERALGTEAARGAWARVGGRVRSFSLVLPEADVAFEVRSATPLIEGIFSILKGCGAGTEERVLGAVTALVGSASGGSFPKPEQASSEQLEAFQASREAFMGGLIERALAAYGDGRNGSDEETGIVLPTRRLQAILAAAGCIVTRKEIEEDMIAGGSQVSRGSTITMPTATTARAALVRRLLRLPLELSPEHPRPPPDAADAAGAADVDVDTAVPSNQEGEGTPENDVGVGDTGAGSVGDAERDRGPADKLSSVAEGKYVEDGDPSRGGGGGGLGSGHERPLGVKSGSGPVEPPSRSAQSVPHHESEDGVREATDDSRSCTTQSSSQGQVDVDVDVDFDVDVGIDADLNKVGVDGDADVVAEVGIEGRDGEDGEDQLKKSGPPVQDVEHTDVGEPKGASVSRRDELGRSQGNDVHHDAEEAMSMLPDTGGTASGEASGVNDVTNMRRTKADEHDGDGGESHEAGGASYAGDHGADLSHGGADDRDARVDTEVDGGGDDQSKGGIVGENIAPEEKEDTGKGSQEGEAPPVKGNGRRWPWRWSISTWGGGTKS